MVERRGLPRGRVAETDNAARLRWERPLVQRARKGDQRAFGELYKRYAPLIFSRILLPKLGARGAAEDALAETFRTAFERLHQYEDQGRSIFSWLARIASNKAMDMHRARARSHRALSNFEGLLAPLRGESERSPFDEVSHTEERAQLGQRIQEVLLSINPRYRRAIELRFLEGGSREACAEALEVKLGTFDVLLLRALRSFRKKWDSAFAEDAAR